ncbi:GNAT family N-acyltransferase [Mesohalobacter halotolerans]|uniref:Lysophospholipid acyltransferase family protein n=1 Tax=Mesohalobacter halotolerans TaxID=1883405 RepID=A0A4U5TTG6_9FLAO|nr:GNAT family N-acyltransferase [Mesohalobacter halotolerans]MBS3738196.1 lysophospholipid acyltransferase family protein [Psychroflexus sp.]TKS57506.1 lysophospholipid acyltransferase family protein [Mesohalobacter halotolerans]
MPIVTASEVSKGLNLNKLGAFGVFFGHVFLRLSKLNKLNAIYDRYKHLDALDFIDAALIELGVSFEIPEKDLKRIPKDGAFISISNHPLGGIDGLILLKLMLEAREDYKVIANFLLQRLKPLEDKVMPVNPFETRQDVKSSVTGLKQALAHLKDGHPLGIFPAGEVSTYKEDKAIVDKPWTDEALKLIKKAEVPVLPVYFHAKNSIAFYKLAKLSDNLRTAKLPSEMLSQHFRNIKVRIGYPINLKDQHQFEDLQDYKAFLRKKTYMLSSSFEKTSLIKSFPRQIKFPIQNRAKKIVSESSQQLILKEIEVCRSQKKCLLKSKNYEVFFAKRALVPSIVREIGRLREITFRSIGEGTNKSIDLDDYDHYYHHMFLWDNEAQKIAGAYRMGLGNEIYKQHGMEGFYLSELFRFEPESHRLMSQSIEMGRAFIIEGYQQKPMPLFLLWKGIVHCTLRFPEHKYLIGGVSISNKFSNFSKSIMIEFMKSNYYDPYLAQYVHPKKEFKVKLKDVDKDFVFDATQADLNKFDRLIDELETDNLRLPVLIKKYIKQNAKVVAFNVDPLFNNSVDGLMYIRIEDLPESTVKPVLEEFQAELESQQHKK